VLQRKHNKASEETARLAKHALDEIVDIKVPGQCVVPGRDTGLGVSFQQIFEESGVDVEVTL